MGRLTFSAKVDNIFNRKYETSGYGGNYAYHDGANVVVDGWAEYYVSAERNFYTQIALELF
jgi:outer membrane receptor protein involved in Fe transport